MSSDEIYKLVDNHHKEISKHISEKFPEYPNLDTSEFSEHKFCYIFMMGERAMLEILLEKIER